MTSPQNSPRPTGGAASSVPEDGRPVDPATLPDPEDITEADLPAPPPRPGRQAPRRFAGTHQQIRSALTMYRVCAWITGVMLLLLVGEMIFKYGFGTELYAGGTLIDGSANTLSFQPEDSVTGGFNISIAVLIAHGWLYVVYLVAAFRLWSLMRWHGLRLLLIAGGGVVPFLSFIVEKRVHAETLQDLADHPEAARRY